jgi:hypothetical protein
MGKGSVGLSLGMPAGYSGTPLIKKLGIREGMKLRLLHAPPDYASLLGTDISAQLCKKKEIPDLVHLFAKSQSVFQEEMKKMGGLSRSNPRLVVWVSWYKKAAGISTDITETVIRNYALSHGWVDIKVCAVSDLWSGLKLVVPLSLR